MVKQNLLTKLLLLFALIVGSASSAWAQTLTVDFESAVSVYSDWTFTTIKTQQTNSNVSAHGGNYYGGTDGKTTGSVVTKSKIASPQSITFYVSKESTNTTASSWLIKVSSDGTTWTQVGDAQSASVGITRGEWTEVSRDLSDYSDVYVGVFYDGTTAKRCIDDVTLTYLDNDNREDCDIELNETALSLDVYNNATATLTATSSSTGAITWESSDETIATVSNSGVVTAIKAGTATITASQAEDENYKAGSAFCTVTVTDSTPFVGGDVTFTAGTDVGSTNANQSPDEMTKSVVTVSSTDAAFATAEYRLYSGSTTTISTSQGKITKIVFTKNGSYSLANLSTQTGSYTSSTGTWTGSATSISFNAAAQVRLNEIVVTVEMDDKADPNFSFGETTEFTVNINDVFTAPTLTYAQGFDGAIVYSSSNNNVAEVDESTGTVLIGAVEGTAIITATSEATANFFAGSASYTIYVEDSRAEAGLAWSENTVTIDLDATEYTLPTLTNPNNLTVTYSSSNEDIAIIDENTGEIVLDTRVKGTATITATFAGNASYKPGSASYTISIEQPVPSDALFWESVSGYEYGDDSTNNLPINSGYLDSQNWASFTKVFAGADGCLKFGNSSSIGTAVTGEIALTGNGKLTYKVRAFNNTRSGKLNVTISGATATGDTQVSGNTDNFSWDEKTVYISNAEGHVVITFETESDNQRIYLDDILVVATPPVSASITSAGYATFSSDKNVDFSANGDLVVYTAKDNGSSITLNEVESKQVPANTAVVLKGAEGTYEGAEIASAEPLTDNDLKIAEENLHGNGKIYVLNKKNGKVGFYKLSETGTLDKGKAYLETENPAPFLGFDGDDTTGIYSVERGALSVEGCYTLDGRRVAQPTKGLYILNGKKVLIP